MYTNKMLLKLLLPLLVETVLNILVGMADTMMVSSLGDAAVSGVALVDQICNVLLGMMAAMATGGAVVTAQLLGAKRRDEACRGANQLVMVTLGAALIIMIPVLIWSRELLTLIFSDIEEDVMDSAMTYLRITALSYPFLAFCNAGAALFRTMNRSKMTMIMSVIANTINIIGNAIFIYGMKSGVEGVAIPTLIARATAGITLIVLLYNPNLELHLMRRAWKPRWQMMKQIMGIGIPNGLENSLFQLGRLLVVRIITVFGTVQIAANAVACTMDNVGIIAGTAMNLGIITVVGQCVGAGDYKQARYYTRKLLLWTYLSMAAINIPMLLLLRPILGLFNLSPEALDLAWILITMHNGIGMLLWPVSFTLPNALRAGSDVRYTMIVAIVSMALFRVMFSYILGLGLGWGAIGVWIAMIMDWVCRITCFVLRYRSGKWENKSIVARV